jgi:hypothetical protein
VSWTPPAGHEIAINFVGAYTPPAGHEVAIRFGVPDDPPPPAPDPVLGVSAGMPWAHARRRLKTVQSGWKTRQSHATNTRVRWREAAPVQGSVRARWAKVPTLDAHALLSWGHPPAIGVSAATPWRRVPLHGVRSILPWDLPPSRSTTAGARWLAPAARQVEAGLPWDLPPARSIQTGASWLHPALRELRLWLPWQQGRRLRWIVGSPGVEPPEEPTGPVYVPPPGHSVALNFACPYIDHPGQAVPLPFGPAACYFAWPKPRRYIVLNSAAVHRLPERTQIYVVSVSVSASRGNVLRDFDMVLADPGQLALLKGPAGSPKEVEINLNGWVFTGIVEKWGRDTQWPATSVRVAGRSRAALLDAPYAPARSYVETADRTAQQLIDRELEFTGFSADVPFGWSWLVPGGAWAYDAQTPIAALARVASAAGAGVIAHPWDDVLLVRPRYGNGAGDPVSPWDWALTAADKIVHDDYVPRLSESGGVSDPGAETVVLPLWPPSANDKPGLVEPYQLVEVAAAESRKGVVDSVRVVAQMVDAGNGAMALVIEQTVTLDMPPVEPRFDYVLVSGEQVGVSDPVIRTGTAGTKRLPAIVDRLITQHAVARERGRNALSAGGPLAASSLWDQIRGMLAGGRYLKGNVTATNADGSVTVATSDGATIRARPLPGQSWVNGAGVFVADGRVVDTAPALPGVTQNV